MRVLHAIHDFLPRHRAGSELYADALCREQRCRHEVAVLCAEYDPALPHATVVERHHEGLPVFEIVNRWEFGSFVESYGSPAINAALARILDAYRPDVLHVHNLLNLSLDLPALARGRGIATVATLHDFTLACVSGGQRVHLADAHVCVDIEPDRCARCFAASPFRRQMSGAPGPPSLWRRITSRGAGADPRSPGAAEIEARIARARQAAEEIQILVAPAQTLADDLRRFGFPARIRVADYGTPPRPTMGRGRREPGPPRVGFVGTLAWHKGVHVLIDALGRLPAGSCEVLLFGDLATFPDYVASLRQQAISLPVHFRGGFAPEAAAAAYAEIDVLVVPSLWPENSPLVIHEAFQAGLPIVAARTGGIPALLGDGRHGVLYEPSSPAALAEALREVLRNPAQAEALVEKRGSVRTMAEDAAGWDDLYAQALAARGAQVRA
jgi:glycosyltransferase involved in cell wall biosynthesis